jgi:hypothetical protein
MRLQVPVVGALGIKVYDPQEPPHTTQQPIAVIDRQETTGWRAELWFDDPEFGQTISGDSARDVLAWIEQRWAEWEHYDRYDRFPAYDVPAAEPAEPAGPPFALALAGLPFPGSTYLTIRVGGPDQAERITTVDHLGMLLDLRPGQTERNSDGVWRYRCKPFPEGLDVTVSTQIEPPPGTPDDRDQEIAYLRAQVEQYRRAAANTLGDHAPTVHDTSTPAGGILPEGVDGFAVGRSVR